MRDFYVIFVLYAVKPMITVDTDKTDWTDFH